MSVRAQGCPVWCWRWRGPISTVTLLEPLLRRASFLTEVVDLLGLPQVAVVAGAGRRPRRLAAFRRGDRPCGRPPASAGSVGAPPRRAGGELVALKGSSAETEIAEAAEAIAAYGGRKLRLETVGDGLVEPPPTVVRIESTGQVGPIRKGRR